MRRIDFALGVALPYYLVDAAMRLADCFAEVALVLRHDGLHLEVRGDRTIDD